MTDRELAIHTTLANEIERSTRTYLGGGDADQDERQVATSTLRQAVSLRKMLESWIVLRAIKAQREQGEVVAKHVTR